MRLNRSDTFKLSLGVSKPHRSGVRTCQCAEGSFSIIPITFPSGCQKCVTNSNHVGCWNVGYCFLSRSGVSGLSVAIFSKSRFRTSPKVAGSRQAQRPSQKKSSQKKGYNPDEVPVDQDNYAENSAYCGSEKSEDGAGSQQESP
jgi:hypothetical protein